MAQFIANIIFDLTEKQSSKPQAQCNYQNNYYGDQVCVAQQRAIK